jgi:hypothetical protein
VYALAIDVNSISKNNVTSPTAEEGGFDIRFLSQSGQNRPGDYRDEPHKFESRSITNLLVVEILKSPKDVELL